VITRILVAVDDSADSFSAARVAIQLAARLGGRLRVLHVSADHLLSATISTASAVADAPQRRAVAATGLLARVSELAAVAGVEVETELGEGEVGPAVVAAAEAWGADLVVLGRAAHHVGGAPYVGSQTRYVLELADLPVLVVPHLRDESVR